MKCCTVFQLECGRRLLSWAGAVAALATAAVSSTGTISALPVTFSQRIHPQDYCTVTTVVQADGSLSYSLPPDCGTLVSPPMPPASPRASTRVPQKSAQRIWTPSVPAPATTPTVPIDDALARVFYGGGTVYLESAPGIQPAEGYMVLAAKESRYTFYVSSDTRTTLPRMFSISAVSQKSVTVQFWPDGTGLEILPGKDYRLDVDGIAGDDVVLRLQQVNADGTVLLRVFFPVQQRAFGVVQEDCQALIAEAILIAAGTLCLYVYLHSWYLARHRLPPADWWPRHLHRPF